MEVGSADDRWRFEQREEVRRMQRLRVLMMAAVMAAAALVLGACGGDDDESDVSTGGTETVKLIQPLPESVYFYPYFVGQNLGYFEEEGVEVELLPASEDVPLTAFVANGDADVAAAGASEVLQGLGEGADYDVVYDYYTRSAENIVVPEDSEILSAEELEGATIGLSSDEDRAFLQSALAEVGLDPESLAGTPKVGTSGPVVADAIRNGDIDAYSGALSDFAALEASGIGVRDITPGALATTPAASFVVTPEVVSDKQEALEGFMRAWAKATYVGIANRDVVEIMAKEAVPEEWRPEEVGQAALDVAIDYQTPVNEDFGEVLPDVWAETQAQLLASGELMQETDVESMLDDQFIAAANDFDREEVEQDAAEWLEANG
jgi:NitT/TauT family transport system substrate-binding protein